MLFFDADVKKTTARYQCENHQSRPMGPMTQNPQKSRAPRSQDPQTQEPLEPLDLTDPLDPQDHHACPQNPPGPAGPPGPEVPRSPQRSTSRPTQMVKFLQFCSDEPHEVLPDPTLTLSRAVRSAIKNTSRCSLRPQRHTSVSVDPTSKHIYSCCVCLQFITVEACADRVHCALRQVSGQQVSVSDTSMGLKAPTTSAQSNGYGILAQVNGCCIPTESMGAVSLQSQWMLYPYRVNGSCIPAHDKGH